MKDKSELPSNNGIVVDEVLHGVIRPSITKENSEISVDLIGLPLPVATASEFGWSYEDNFICVSFLHLFYL